jgi:hypothetical protein
MADNASDSDLRGAALAAAHTSELAADNIRRYLAMHSTDVAAWKMRILDQAIAETKAIVDKSAHLAVTQLQLYLENREA